MNICDYCGDLVDRVDTWSNGLRFCRNCGDMHGEFPEAVFVNFALDNWVFGRSIRNLTWEIPE